MKTKMPQIKMNSAYFIVTSVALIIFASVIISVPKETWKGLLSGKISNLATVFLSSKLDYLAGPGSRSVFSTDFNNDNKLDLAVANYDSTTVSILLGNGLGGFGPKTDFGVGSNPLSVFSADFDNDGKQDLATANYSSSTVSILLGNGLGGFGLKADFSVSVAPTSVFSADFDNDGDQDLAVANRFGNNVSILLITTTPNPVPTISGIFPISVTAGGSSFSLTVNGTGFIGGSSVVKVNGSPRTTTYVSPTQLTAIILANDIATAGTSPIITVFNP